LQTEWILVRAQGGEFARHEAALWKCVKNSNPQTLEILKTLAACFIKEFRFAAAHTCLDEWLEREPKSILALQWRGLVREALHERANALADYARVLELAPDHWRARLQMAQLLIGLSRFPDAFQQLQILQQTHSDQHDVQFTLGQYLFKQGKDEQARQIFLQLSTKDYPKQSKVLYYLGKLEHEPAKAEYWLRKSLKKDPADLDARFALYTNLRQQPGRQKDATAEILAYQASKKDEEKIRTLLESIQTQPRNPDVLASAGGLLSEKFRNPQGLNLVFRALFFDPNHRQAHAILARYYEKNHQRAKAAKHREFSQPAGLRFNTKLPNMDHK
jgi:Tfp pilus assembly protein PilF